MTLRGTAICRQWGMPLHFTLTSASRTPRWAVLPIENEGLLPSTSDMAVREKFVPLVTLSTAVTEIHSSGNLVIKCAQQ